MPTVRRAGPYRFFFFINEGLKPPHIHVQRDQSLARFWLEPIALASSTGCCARELRRIEQLVAESQQEFQEAWREFFGA